MNFFLNKVTLQTLFRYAVVGVINTFIGVGIIIFGASLGLHYVVYTLIGYVTGMIISFILNARFTFKSKNDLSKRFQAFVIINITNLLIVQLTQMILIERLNYPESLAVGLGIILYFVIGFIANKRYVFNTDNPIRII